MLTPLQLPAALQARHQRGDGLWGYVEAAGKFGAGQPWLVVHRDQERVVRRRHAQRAQPLLLEALHCKLRAAQRPGHPVKRVEPDGLLVIAYHARRIRHFNTVKCLTHA